MPHPFDRLHSVPDYEHLLDIVEEIDILEVFNPRVAFSAFNEEAERFAAKYRIVPGAGSDGHVAQALGSVRIRLNDFDGPEEFLESMRSADIVRKHKNLVYVQALKWMQARRRRAGARRSRIRDPCAAASRSGAWRRAARVDSGTDNGMQPQGESSASSKERHRAHDGRPDPEKYLERAIRELNSLTHELQDCQDCPRGNLMPVLGSGHPQADVMLLKHAPSVAEIEEGVAFYGRAGNAVMKSLKRLGIDPLVVYGTLCVKCPLSDPALASPDCIARLVREVMIVEPRCMVVMGESALDCLNDVAIPLAAAGRRPPGRDPAADPDDRRHLHPRHRRLAGLRGRQARLLARLPRARRVVRGPAARTERAPGAGAVALGPIATFSGSMRTVGSSHRVRASPSSPPRLIGFGVPLGWIWIGSQLQGDSGASDVDFSVAMAILFGIIATYVCCSTSPGIVMASSSPQGAGAASGGPSAVDAGHDRHAPA